MALEILKATELKAVRDTLGLDDMDLPDEAITSSVIGPVAEAELIRRFPTWESFDDTDAVFFKKALVHYTAYLIAPRLKLLLAKQEADNKNIFTRFDSADPSKVATEQYGWFKWSMKRISSYSSVEVPDQVLSAVSPSVDPVSGT